MYSDELILFSVFQPNSNNNVEFEQFYITLCKHYYKFF